MKLLKILDTRSVCDENIFFGYYTRKQINSENLALLIKVDECKLAFQDRRNSEIGYIDLKVSPPKIKFIFNANVFNYQEGNSVQWINYMDKECIILNVLTPENKINAQIRDLSGEILKTFNYGYHCFNEVSQKIILSDFIGLSIYRNSYSYPGISYNFKNLIFKDRFYISDFEGNIINEVQDENEEDYFFDNFNIFKNDMVVFNLRKSNKGDLKTTLCTFKNEDSKITKHHEIIDSSHYNIISEEEIVIWGKIKGKNSSIKTTVNYFKNLIFSFHFLRNKIIKAARFFNLIKYQSKIGMSSFHIYNLKNNTSFKIESFLQDGHPTAIKFENKSYIISDTYASNRGKLSISCSCIEEGSLIKLVDLNYDPRFSNSEYRCDSHPRWDESTNIISIDCLEEGKRFMRFYKLVS